MLTENRWENVSSPQVKVKYRSIVPTVFSLLIDDPITMTSENGTTETQDLTIVRAQEIKVARSYASSDVSVSEEIKKILASEETKFLSEKMMNKNVPISNSRIFNSSKGLPLSLKFNRSAEDIYIREDEDGVLSHFCPLDKNRDGVQEDEENVPETPPTKVDYMDWIKDGCNLDSEEIPYLMAEPPTNSEDSLTENTVSNIDSSTSMIYPLLQNQQFIQREDKELQGLLQDRKQSPSFRTLDKNILDAWSEMSSEEEFYVPKENDEEMLKKYGLGNESDMEEFETNDIENKGSKEEIHQKAVSFEEESLKNNPEDESEKNTASEPSNENSGDPNIETTEGEKDTSESKKDDRDESNDSNKQNGSYQSDDDQVPIELLKSEAENAMIDAAVSLNLSVFKLEETLLNNSTTVTVEMDGAGINKIVTPIEHSNETEICKIRCEHHEEKLQSEKDEERHERNRPNEGAAEVKIESLDSRMETKANVIPNSKEEKQEKLLMESVAMNLTMSTKIEEEQSDLKTALRFMTEIYRSKDDDYLCFDTLSDMDVPLNVEKPKGDVKNLGGTPVELLVNLKSPKKSTNSETGVTEEARPVIRPRNKLTKLFSSFKKKFGKKAHDLKN